jgi:hypothetical protein
VLVTPAEASTDHLTRQEIDRERHHTHDLPGERELPPGIDETRIAVIDDTSVIATTWRPADNYQPGPATWDWRLNVLGYTRISAWRPDEFGFGYEVQTITRGNVDDA